MSIHRNSLSRLALLLALPLLLLAGCDQTPSSASGTGSPTSTGEDSDKAIVNKPRKTGVIGNPRPPLKLASMADGKPRDISEWDGKILVVNFWATWCPPCRKEMPMFVKMQEQYRQQGLQFIGVAIDDRDKVQDFMDTVGVNYPMLIGAQDAIDAAKAYGDRFGALPYSVIIDRDGVIRHIQRGELHEETLLQVLNKLL
jgi:thiol-disulfide isomerase/thioredoxin